MGGVRPPERTANGGKYSVNAARRRLHRRGTKPPGKCAKHRRFQVFLPHRAASLPGNQLAKKPGPCPVGPVR